MTHEEEQEYKEKIGSPEMEHLQYLMENPTPTPSDTFIEEKMKEFEKTFCNNHQKPIRFLRSIFYDEQDGAEQIEQFLKSSLQEQRQSILEEIEKALNSTDNILGGDTNKLIHLQCHLKSLLKNN